MEDQDKARREVSSIGFPYLDLDDAVAVAKVMLDRGAVPMDRDQMAAALGQVPTSGAFNIKLSTTRMFGLIESSNGKNQLTPLGFEILDAARERAARAEAFLNVPLFKKIYDDFKGRQLPPRPAGLEQAFVAAGVSTKQKERARQVFDRSARAANFFPSPAEDRLVQPLVGAQSSAAIEAIASALDGSPSAEQAAPAVHRESAGHPPRGLNPFIAGLLDELPPKGDAWSIEDQANWLQAAAQIFRLLYKGDGEIVVTVRKAGQ